MYYLNKEQTTAYFFPSRISWKKKLSPIEHFFSCLVPSGGLYFKGKINVNKFLDAMQLALDSFHFLFCHISRDKKNLYAHYSINNSIKLEIEKRAEVIGASTFSILPTKIDLRMLNGAVDDLEGLPMCSFKLTELTDGFIIGYYMNHSLFDQSSTFYFFKYLSYLYTYGFNISLPEPYLINTDILEEGCSKAFESLEDLRAYGELLMGVKYSPRKSNNLNSLSYSDPDLSINLTFDLNEIDKFKTFSVQHISANDVIHAILLKIYSSNPDLLPEQVFCLNFPCNMRKRCGVGENAIGNIINHARISLTIEEIRKATVLELALMSRKCISEVTTVDFAKNLTWYREIEERGESSLDYMPTLDFLNCRATNWSTFPYHQIQFDECYPFELKAPCYATYGVNVIAFYTKNNEKKLKTSVCIRSSYLNAIKELEVNTKVFVCSEIFNRDNTFCNA